MECMRPMLLSLDPMSLVRVPPIMYLTLGSIPCMSAVDNLSMVWLSMYGVVMVTFIDDESDRIQFCTGEMRCSEVR